MEERFKDFLDLSEDIDIMNQINNETLYYSNKVIIYTAFILKTDRILILTDKSIFLFNNKKLQIQRKYEDISGITFSTTSNELVIHSDEDVVFHFLTQDKNLIIYIIAKCYENLLNKPITLYEVEEKSLKYYANPKFKIRGKNLGINEKTIIDTRTFIIDNDPLPVKTRKRRSFTTLTSKGILDYLSNPHSFKEKQSYSDNKFIFSNNSEIKYINLRDFNIIKIIGRGNLGKVFLAKNKLNEGYYALKSVDKNIYNKNIIKTLIKLTQNLNFPFLNNIEFCLETKSRLYLASPFINGEELFDNIRTLKNLDEGTIKFYAAMIALSLDFLYKNGIGCINITTKNIFIDERGYLQLFPCLFWDLDEININNNERLLDRFKNEYSPPEAFSEDTFEGKDFLPWWNLGIIIFEMKYGIPPFYSDKHKDLENMIRNNQLKFPEDKIISEYLKDLINKLLDKNVQERLGYKNGFEEIKNHIFFQDMNFEDLKEKVLKAPYIPTLAENVIDYNKKEDIYRFEDLQKFNNV